MDYQIATVTLKDGRRFSNIVALHCKRLSYGERAAIPFSENEIDEIIVDHGGRPQPPDNYMQYDALILSEKWRPIIQVRKKIGLNKHREGTVVLKDGRRFRSSVYDDRIILYGTPVPFTEDEIDRIEWFGGDLFLSPQA